MKQGGESNDHIYLLVSGKIRQLVSTHKIYSSYFANKELTKEAHHVLNTLKRGDIFGEESALLNQDSPCSIEVYSNEAVVYKIHRSNFVQHFGGLDGVPATTLRALGLMKRNWLDQKMRTI